MPLMIPTFHGVHNCICICIVPSMGRMVVPSGRPIGRLHCSVCRAFRAASNLGCDRFMNMDDNEDDGDDAAAILGGLGGFKVIPWWPWCRR